MPPKANMSNSIPHAIEPYGSRKAYAERHEKSYFENGNEDVHSKSKLLRKLIELFGKKSIDEETQAVNENNVDGAFDYASMDGDLCVSKNSSMNKPVVGEWISFDHNDSVPGTKQGTKKTCVVLPDLDENENIILDKTKKGFLRVKMAIQIFDQEHQIIHKTGNSITNIKKFVVDGVIDIQKKHAERNNR